MKSLPVVYFCNQTDLEYTHTNSLLIIPDEQGNSFLKCKILYMQSLQSFGPFFIYVPDEKSKELYQGHLGELATVLVAPHNGLAPHPKNHRSRWGIFTPRSDCDIFHYASYELMMKNSLDSLYAETGYAHPQPESVLKHMILNHQSNKGSVILGISRFSLSYYYSLHATHRYYQNKENLTPHSDPLFTEKVEGLTHFADQSDEDFIRGYSEATETRMITSDLYHVWRSLVTQDMEQYLRDPHKFILNHLSRFKDACLPGIQEIGIEALELDTQLRSPHKVMVTCDQFSDSVRKVPEVKSWDIILTDLECDNICTGLKTGQCDPAVLDTARSIAENQSNDDLLIGFSIIPGRNADLTLKAFHTALNLVRPNPIIRPRSFTWKGPYFFDFVRLHPKISKIELKG